jgi:hypothetical protein
MSNTPILDRELPLPAAQSKTWRLSLLGGAISGVLVFLCWYFDKTGIFPPLPYLLIGFLPALEFGVLIHELGHVLAGLSAGFELRMLSVGGFFLTRETQGWKFRFFPRRMLSAGGQTLMVPRSADRLVDRYLRLVLGGPAATMLLLVLTLMMAVVFPGSAGIRVLLLLNLLLAVQSCVPYNVRGMATDAKVVLLLIGRGPAAERLAALLYIIAVDAQGIGPRDWPRELVDKMNVPTSEKAFLTSAISVRYAVALDSGDPERIAEAVERALLASDEAGPDVQQAFYVAAACFQGIFRNNVPLAEAWLASAREVKNAASLKDWDSKALAAIAMARGDRAQARELLTRYLAVLDRYPATGMVAVERAQTANLLGRTEGAAA